MAAALREQLKAHVADMVDTGLLDEQFQQLHKFQGEDEPGFIADVVELFCNETDFVINRLTELLENPVVDFDMMDIAVHQLKGSTGSVGVHKVKNASIQLREFCLQKDRDGCLKALETARAEYYEVRSKFRTVIQLERQIQNLS